MNKSRGKGLKIALSIIGIIVVVFVAFFVWAILSPEPENDLEPTISTGSSNNIRDLLFLFFCRFFAA